jgi:hypothetical protein
MLGAPTQLKYYPPMAACDTTMTPRVGRYCACQTYEGNGGPCETFEAGKNERCVYCDHADGCHVKDNVETLMGVAFMRNMGFMAVDVLRPQMHGLFVSLAALKKVGIKGKSYPEHVREVFVLSKQEMRTVNPKLAAVMEETDELKLQLAESKAKFAERAAQLRTMSDPGTGPAIILTDA